MKRKLTMVAVCLAIVVGCRSPQVRDGAEPVDAAGITDGTYQWQSVPLRTAEQKARGYSGGEGAQMGFVLTISPSDPNFLAAGYDTAGVYVSEDGAQTWEMRHTGFRCMGVQSVCFDPLNPQIMYAAGINGPIAGRRTEGIYRSTDAGRNWELILPTDYERRRAQNEYFAFDPRSFDGTLHRTIYAATRDDGLLKSTDGGESWATLGFEGDVINAVVLHPQDPELLFVAADTGLYRSRDAGRTFEPIGANLPAGAAVYGLAVNSQDTNILYVALGTAGIWRSYSGGLSFSQCMNGIPSWDLTADWRRLAISPVDPDVLYADADQNGGRLPYHSFDGGATWVPTEAREPVFYSEDPDFANHWWSEGVVAHPSEPMTAYFGTPIWRTTDGGVSWQYASEGISGSRWMWHTSIAFRPDNPDEFVIFHFDEGATRTIDGGDTFAYCPAPRQADIGAITMSVGAYRPGTDRLVSTVGGWTTQRICTSDDNGDTWTVQPGTEGDYRFIAFSPQDPSLVYLGRVSDSLRSTDGGRTWDPLEYPIRAIYEGDGDVVYAVRQLYEDSGNGTYQPTLCEVVRSTDRGETWETIPGQISSIADLAVDPIDMNRIYATGYTGVRVFDGEQWTLRDDRHGLVRNQFGNLSIQGIAIDPNDPAVIYVGQNENWNGLSGGVFMSRDYGDTWIEITGNLGPMLTVWAITVSPADSSVWIATDYGSWRLAAESAASPRMWSRTAP